MSYIKYVNKYFFFFSSRRRHTRFDCDWSSDVCSSDLVLRRRELRQHCRWDAEEGERFVVARACTAVRTIIVEAERLRKRSEERRVGKECRSRWSPYQ